MEQQFSNLQNFFTFLLLIFMVFKIWKKSTKPTQNLPPGPWKLPLIGSTHHLITSQTHHRLRDLAKKYGPVMHLQLGEITNIVISSTETAKEVMKTHDILFAQRPYLLFATVLSYDRTDIVFAPYGDYWRKMRKICTLELLTTKRVQSFRSIREEEVLKHMRSLSSCGGSPINFSALINSLTYNIISRAAFGKIWKGQESFISIVKDMIIVAGGFTVADVYPSIKLLHWISGMLPRLQRIQDAVDKIFQSIIDDHRTKRVAAKSTTQDVEDFIDVLLNSQDEGDLDIPITDDNIKAVILDIFVAGSETTSSTIEWAMSELLKDSRVMKKAQEEVRRIFAKEGKIYEERIHELSYLESVIKETLRLHPPLPLVLPRECRESCVINGYDIPVKSKVVVNVWAIGRDPNHWTEPEKFYPERFQDCSTDYKGTDFELLPFGAGRRMCPGALFAVTNLKSALAQLLYHFDWKLPTGVKPETLDMTEVFGAVVQRKTPLHAVPIPVILPIQVK